MEADKFILERKITELEQINKVQAEELDNLRKQSETNKLDKITNTVDRLIISKKILSRDRDKEIRFTLSLADDLARAYFEKLESGDDLISLDVKSKTGIETDKK